MGPRGLALTANAVDLGRLPKANCGVRTVVLVEGESDRIALQTLACRCGADLPAAGVVVAVMYGITNTYKHLERYRKSGVPVAGLYDTAEERHLRSALDRTGIPGDGFFGCDPDLEYELIRALGTEAVEAVIEAEGELRSLRLLAGMPAQQGWSRDDLLHRFLGVRAGRKARYARSLVEVLDLEAAPRPLLALLEYLK